MTDKIPINWNEVMAQLVLMKHLIIPLVIVQYVGFHLLFCLLYVICVWVVRKAVSDIVFVFEEDRSKREWEISRFRIGCSVLNYKFHLFLLEDILYQKIDRDSASSENEHHC